MLDMLDLLSQSVITVGGLAAILLVSRNNRWGFVVGFLQQPFWFVTTILNHQWGMFILSLAYSLTWTYGVYRNFWKREEGMSKEKVLAILDTYRRAFFKKGIKKKDYPHGVLLQSIEDGLQHCHGMLDKITEFVEQDRMGKAFRWLGFIQGVLWLSGIYTLNDLKNHNRPSSS